MFPRARSAWVLVPLALLSVREGRPANGPDAGETTLECEATSTADAAEALFRVIELSAYRIHELARGCRSALIADADLDVPRHLTDWLEVLDQVKAVDETLRSIAAGWHVLSAAQRRAWTELENRALKIYKQANETVRELGESTTGVQSEHYVQALVETHDRSLQIAQIVVALDHCGELRILPDTRVPLNSPEWNSSIHPGIWE